MEVEEKMQYTWSPKEKKKTKFKGLNLKTYLVG
jgi:hypothetical protein